MSVLEQVDTSRYREFRLQTFGNMILIFLMNMAGYGAMGQETTSSLSPSTASIGGEGIEKEVLGPLRVWHIIAIIATLALIALIVFCYCHDYRIPRSRKEIEENHEKRMLNKKYLHTLERNPDELLAKPPVADTTHNGRRNPREVLQKHGQRAVTHRENDRSSKARSDPDYFSNVTRPRPKSGLETPLAMHPRDLLALMEQVQKKTTAR